MGNRDKFFLSAYVLLARLPIPIVAIIPVWIIIAIRVIIAVWIIVVVSVCVAVWVVIVVERVPI